MGTLATKTKQEVSVLPFARSLFLRNMLKAMDDKGLTVDQIARESGLDRMLVKKLVGGEIKPSRSILQRLSMASSIGITYKTLVTWCLLDDSLRYASANSIGI